MKTQLHKVDNEAAVRRLSDLAIGAPHDGSYAINNVELLFLVKRGLVENELAGLMLQKKGITANKKTQIVLSAYLALRDAGRIVRFDKDDTGVMYVYPPGNCQENKISEYVLVVCGKGKNEVSGGVFKAAGLGRKLRKDAVVAVCGIGGCEFIKIRQFKLKPVS